MQGLLSGRGFDCLLGEVSTLELSSATALPVPGTCCLRGVLGDSGTDQMVSRRRLWELVMAKDAAGGLVAGSGSLLLQHWVMLWEGCPLGL